MPHVRPHAHRRRLRTLAALVSAFALALTGVGLAAVPASADAGGSISGSVALPDGSPMTFGQVTAIVLDETGDTTGFSWSADVQSDGSFHIAGVEPGDYTLQIRPGVRQYLDEYWPDAVDVASAQVITVAEGDAVTGIDARVDAAGVISGTLTGYDGSTPSPRGRAILSFVDADGGLSSAPSLIVSADDAGRYTLDGITPGRYALRFTPEIVSGRRAHITHWGDTLQGYIEVGRSEVLTGIDASVWNITDVVGTVTDALGRPVVSGQVTLRYDTGETLTTDTRFDGMYLFFGVHPGRATLRFESYDRPDSITWLGGGRTLATATWLTLSEDDVDASQQLVPLTIARPEATVFGTPQVGRRLDAATGGGDADTKLSYQWRAEGVDIANATARTFTPGAAQLGKRLSVRVTWTQPGYTTEVRTSAASKAVIAGKLAAATPKISGTLAVGSRVTARPGTWTSGTGLTYQWYANGRAISGATRSSLLIGTAQKGAALTVRVVGRKAGYTTVVKKSAASLKIVKASTPSVSGAAKVGSRLSAKPGTWSSALKLSYRWYADGAAISGATRSTFVVTSAQRGRALTVKVTGRASGYATVSKTSKATLRVPRVATPAISGRAYATLALTAKTGTWSSGTSFTYRWYADGRAISGATSRSLTLGERHRGARITVKVTGRKSGYTTVVQTSAVTKAVKSGKSRPASKDNCPRDYPVKGNQTTRHTTDWIYHVPGGDYYAVTDPEECFVSPRAAENAGYRASMR